MARAVAACTDPRNLVAQSGTYIDAKLSLLLGVPVRTVGLHSLVFAVQRSQLLKGLLIWHALGGMHVADVEIGPTAHLDEHFVSGRVQIHSALELEEVPKFVRLLHWRQLQLASILLRLHVCMCCLRDIFRLRKPHTTAEEIGRAHV